MIRQPSHASFVISYDFSTLTPGCFLRMVLTKAQTAAARWYSQWIVALNVGFLLLRSMKGWNQHWNYKSVVGTMVLWVLQYFAYQGVIRDAGQKPSSTASSASATLAGGAALDVLGLALLVQLGSVWSLKWYWLLLLLPVGSAWHFYNTVLRPMLGSFPVGAVPANSVPEPAPVATTKRGAAQKKAGL